MYKTKKDCRPRDVLSGNKESLKAQVRASHFQND